MQDLTEALNRIKHYIAVREATPLRGIGDTINMVHSDGELKYSDLKLVVAALDGKHGNPINQDSLKFAAAQFEAMKKDTDSAYIAMMCIRGIEVIDEALKMPPSINDGWLQIETAPKDGTQIDLWITKDWPDIEPDDPYRASGYKWSKENDYWVGVSGNIPYFIFEFQATHWMPIPEAPE